MTEQKIALFDLDGSLADFNSALVEELRKIQGPNEPEINPENLWDLDEIPYMKQRMRLIKRTPGWWQNLKIIENGLIILKAAKEIGFANHILTQGPKTNSGAWKEKLDWCQEHIFDLVDSVNIVGDKGLVYGNLLYDDYPEYMSLWLSKRPRGLGIMPVNDYNKYYEHPRVIKWDGTNLDEVLRGMSIAYTKNSNEKLVL